MQVMRVRVNYRWPLAAALLMGIAFAGLRTQVSAASLTQPMSVTATVQAGCSALSPQALAFGNFLAGFGNSGGLSASTTIRVTCANGVPYTLSRDAGQHSDDTNLDGILDTNMSDGIAGHNLRYILYQDAAHTTEWSAQLGINVINGTGSGTEQQVPIYGSVPYPQSPPTGSYTDSVGVTLTF